MDSKETYDKEKLERAIERARRRRERRLARNAKEAYQFEAAGEDYETEEEDNEMSMEPVPDEEPPQKTIRTKRENNLDFINVQTLSNFLSKVKLVWPENLPGYNVKAYNALAINKGYPRTYFHNTSKEKAILWHAENFRRQFLFQFPDRRPLFIAPKNECDYQKLLPTYLKPCLLPYPVLFYAESCIDYFKDFFNTDFLEPCTDVPPHVRSHLAVFKDRKANCYEHSIIIATILIGAGYNAYVVDGYATKEVTTLCTLEDFTDTFQEHEDEFKEALKIEKPKHDVFNMNDLVDVSLLREEEIIRPVSPSKYKLRMKKHFISSYQDMMKERDDQLRSEAEEKAREKEAQEMIENQPPVEVDPLLGFRIHCWILIMPGSREVTEPFFLEPFTGTRRELTDDAFLGIESIFNHKNFWVNLQDCATGVGDLDYDFENLTCWAKLLLEPPSKPKPTTGNEGPIRIIIDDEEDEEIEVPEMYLNMPVSWTVNMEITAKEYKRKYPGGSKSFDYNDALVERAAPYAEPDGMLQKVLKFNGTSRKASNLLFIDERFDKRQDKLIRRNFVTNGRIIHEYFDKGRPDSLKEHIYFAGRHKAHTPRHLYYFAGWHPECVSHRQVIPNGIIEEFENRTDHLYFRQTFFGGVLCFTEKGKVSKTEEFKTLTKGGDNAKTRPRRIILGVLEKYNRNVVKKADEDIAEKHILIAEGKIYITFHYGEDAYTRSTLEFFKPDMTKLRKDNISFQPQNSHEFHSDPFTPPWSNYKKSLLLSDISSDESKLIERLRLVEDEIYKTVNQRLTENWYHKLDNEVSENVDELLKEAVAVGMPEEEEDKDPNEVLDFASPYLLWGAPHDKEEEIDMKKRIMEDAKNRIARQAEYITTCYREESGHLKEILKHGCTETEAYIAETEAYEDCFQRILDRLHVMEQKLIRLQAKAPSDYCSLLIQVLQHPLLNIFAIQEHEEEEDELERLEHIKFLKMALILKSKQRRSCCQLDYLYRYAQDGDDEEWNDETWKPKPIVTPPITALEEEDEEEEEGLPEVTTSTKAVALPQSPTL